MATDLENSIRNAAQKVAEYVEDVSTMTVETKYVMVAADGDVAYDQAKPIARTVIKIDADSESIVPMVEGTTGRLEIDNALLDLHVANVAAATEYRARMLDILVGLLKSYS